jgi:hypothetical protein
MDTIDTIYVRARIRGKRQGWKDRYPHRDAGGKPEHFCVTESK